MPDSNLPTEAAHEYARRRDDYKAQLERLDRRSLLLANGRGLAFVGTFALIGLSFWGKLPGVGYWGAGGSALLFLVLAVAHDKVLRREQRMRHRVAINERGVARLEDRWHDQPHHGSHYLRPEHPYATDLNIFGRASLFQRLDTTSTKQGEETLAGWLLAPSSPPELRLRQPAVAELAPMLDFREELETEGRVAASTKPDPARLIQWAESKPILRHQRHWLLAARVLPPITIALWALHQYELLALPLYYLPLGIQLVIVGLTARQRAEVFNAVNTPGEKFVRFEELFAVLERVQWKSELLQKIGAQMKVEGAPPSLEMKRLGRAVSFLQARLQPLFHFIFNAVFLWDLHWIAILEDWQVRCGPKARDWFTAMGEFEALCSLGAFSYENPRYPFPELVEQGPRFVATRLGHPLIPASKRVDNDVSLPGPGNALMITGSNMAGKTTLLRTIGVNSVLALAGAPVCAESLSISYLEVHTSMRVQDSLAEGVSFFYAELKRLKGVVDAVDGKRPVMFLLDEVLLGTNTAERQLASMAIVKQLVERGAIGGITTHDLGMTKLEEQTGGKIRNTHFTDKVVDGQMSFDYVMRPGVVSTTNALALLKIAGIEVPIPKSTTAG